MSVLIWFMLYDSDTGLPYKGTSASKVSVSSFADVDDFRKAVKAEVADSHLKGVAPLDLVVYKNKAAFDKRNSDDGIVKVLPYFDLITGGAS